MKHNINKAAVLGAGTMGAQIAGHLANAGISCLLFDINQDTAEQGKEVLSSLKPAPLYKLKNVELITACNYQHDLQRISETDWILEAVVEQLDIKEKVYSNLLPYLKESTILTSNTSGIPLSDLTKNLPTNVKKRFMITHFFNPPRYMHCLLYTSPSPRDAEESRMPSSA